MDRASTSPSDSHGIAALLSREYGLTGTISGLGGENDNYAITTRDGHRYVLKLADDGRTSQVIDLEHAAVEAVQAANLDLELPRIVPTRGGGIEARISGSDGRALRGRLLEFVGGTPWCEAGPPSRELLRDLGWRVAQVSAALAGVDHPAARRTHRWDLEEAHRNRPGIDLVGDAERREVLEWAFHLHAASARPVLAGLPHALIHGDLNDENLLVAGGRVTGVLDFGDCLYNPTICELAIALAYVLLDAPRPLAAGAAVVAGYHAVRPLAVGEVEVLFPLICARWAVSVVVAAQRRRIDPHRSNWYVTEERAWRALLSHATRDPVDVGRRLGEHVDLPLFADRGEPDEELLARRQRHFSAALALSYGEPLKIARGRGSYLFDHQARPYLDLYNNVCHVGHCHPRVVAAARRQMARLNTNTRYLYDGLTDYAERLCATLPAALQYCFFVNSGSEANELALRLAMAYTGRKDMLVVDGAYHGHTTTMIDISPYKFLGRGGRGRAEPWVHVVPVPDGYRGRHKGQGGETGRAYGDEVSRVIAAAGRPIAGFITESLQSCAGQVIPPAGYLETAFHHVRATGGVCIVDEVQVGFGRVGTHFWGFEQQGVVPDIVVMGKPIGNGHPLGAVVTTEEIARSLADTGMEFFATFGGNPVSCAIGMAVLDVVRDEELQQNALRVGTRLRDGLRRLMNHHALIGDVRGTGLFIGIELVRDRETLEPAGAEAEELVNRLRHRGILTGTDGPFHNVIKIKPPMVLGEAEVDMAIRVIDDEL